MMAKKQPETVLRAVRSMTGLAVAYRKQLDALINEMNDSVLYWVRSEYRKTGIAQDDAPVGALSAALGKLTRRWQKRFDAVAKTWALRFAQKVLRHSDRGLADAYKTLGVAIHFETTDSVKNALDSVIAENVALIRSIPEQHFKSIEVLTMQSAGRGRDVGWLTEQLQHSFGVTRRRAAFIARDQNNKATATMQSARQQDLGITEGLWRHSGAGKHPRPSHQKAGRDRLRFDLKRGAYLDGKWVLPGEEINCRCSWSAVIPGFTKLIQNEQTTRT